MKIRLFIGILSISLISSAALANVRRAFRPEHVGYETRGHWIHDRHEGRLGWWWVVGNSWRFFPRPYVVDAPRTIIIQQEPPVTVMQPAPPVTVVQAAPPQPAPVLYYCRATGTYYPDTMTCPGGWSIATAGTPPSP